MEITQAVVSLAWTEMAGFSFYTPIAQCYTALSLTLSVSILTLIMMSNLFLSPFFASIESDGFRLTIRDYERIALVLSTGGKWTVTRLRSVLVALLILRDAEMFRDGVGPS